MSTSGWFNSCINWWRFSSCFRNIWFAASILGWCCNRKHSISAWVCSTEKIFWELLLQFRTWILFLSSKNLRIRRLWGLQWILLCIFTCVHIWLYRCLTLKKLNIILSLVGLLNIFFQMECLGLNQQFCVYFTWFQNFFRWIGKIESRRFQ